MSNRVAIQNPTGTRGLYRFFYFTLRHLARNWRAEYRNWQWFWQSFEDYQRIAPMDRQPRINDLQAYLTDRTATTPIDPVYFYQDAWAFEKIVQRRPAEHFDVGSHHKYVALLSKVVPVTMIDIRPLALPMESIRFRPGSITELPFADGTVASLSSLCVVEHIGLGRYGDPLDPDGTEKAVRELVRVLAPGGRLYLSLPVARRDKIVFNAHRLTAIDRVAELTAPARELERRFIVGRTMSDEFAEVSGEETVVLLELTK